MKSVHPSNEDSAQQPDSTSYTPPAIKTVSLAQLWRRLGPAVALTSSPDLFESLVPSDPADGLFDD